MSTLKILFLDIDGVLSNNNSKLKPSIPYPSDFRVQLGRGWPALSNSCVSRLNEITSATDAKIVVSSGFRLSCERYKDFEYMCDYLYEEGIDADIIDKTPAYLLRSFWQFGQNKRIESRGKEIQQWLDAWHGIKIDAFVILDDQDDMEHLAGFHVCTSESKGLLGCDVEHAIKILCKT